MPWLEPDVNDHLEELADDGVPAVVLVPDRLRLRPHGGRLRPRHRGAATAESSGCPRRRAATAGIDPRFVAMVRDLLLERAAAERGEDVVRAAVGALGRARPLRRSAAAPTRAADRPALCGRRRRDGRTRRRAARARRRRRPRGGRLVASGAARGVDGRRHQVQRRRRGHRGRPGRGAADPRPLLDARPDDGSSGRRATTSPAPPACAGSSTPSTAPSTSSTASRSTPSRSRPSSTARSVAGVVVNVATGDGVHRHPRRRRQPRRRPDPGPRPRAAGPAAGRHRLRLRARERRGRRPRRSAATCCLEVRDIRRLGSCALDLCDVAEGAPTATSRRA